MSTGTAVRTRDAAMPSSITPATIQAISPRRIQNATAPTEKYSNAA